MKLKRVIAIACTAAMTASLISGCGGSSDEGQKEAVKEAEGTAKEDLPLAKYPETVTVHLGGKMNPNAKIPEGMSFEDNSYTRLLKDDLNIEVVYDWVASMSDYDEKMSLCIGSNTVPEIMNVNAAQYRALLKYDMIQPLDDYFDDYASDALKSYVESGGDELMDCITNDDGEIMAIPAPNLTAGGVNEMWIRQDWLDALGLEAPRTWDELAQVANAFVTEDPDGNGEDDTIGILGPGNADHMNAVGGNQFGLDPLFSCYQSYPQYWLEGEDGKVEYGSIQPETKTALENISKLYADGDIDPEMLVRSDSKEPLLAGKVGIFFGPWWCAYTFADTTLSGSADWRAYFTPLSEDGKYYTHMAEPTTQYVVASKDCKNPEAAFKIINYLIANEQTWVEEGVTSTEMGTADFYPLYNAYDNADEIETCNIGFHPRAWEAMFEEVKQDNFGLEWEPTHQMVQLIDPVSQLRKWCHKIVHVHGKDATIDWNAVRHGGISGAETFVWHRMPGFGNTNWSDIISILRANGYEDDICIEGYHDPVYSGEWEMTGQLHALRYLKWCRGGDYEPVPWEV